jgi:hypothetical protein
MPKQNVKKVSRIIRDYARREDGDEAGAARHRYKEERIDRSKGLLLVISRNTFPRTSMALVWIAISMGESLQVRLNG